MNELKTLLAIQETLIKVNEWENSPICDTIWHTSTETLFDFIQGRIEELIALGEEK